MMSRVCACTLLLILTSSAMVLSTGCGTALSHDIAKPAMTLSGPGSLTLGMTAQYSAHVTGAQVGTPVWSVNSIPGGNAVSGTISAGGLYSAPQVMSGHSEVVLSAVLAGSPTVSSSLTLSLVSPVTAVEVQGPASLHLGQGVQFTAAVAGSPDQDVVWQVNGVPGGSAAVGTISTSGWFSPPATMPGTNLLSIAAISRVDSETAGSAVLTLLEPAPEVQTVSVSANQDVSYVLDLKGSNFLPSSVVLVNDQPVPTTRISGNELQSSVPAPPAGTQQVAVSVKNPGPGETTSSSVLVMLTQMQVTATAAARLLDQASFGPTAESIRHVQQIGLAAYIEEQLKEPASLIPDFPASWPKTCAINGQLACYEAEWFQIALSGSDQLRQRVATALANIWVAPALDATEMTQYLNLMAKDALGNYRKLMYDVATSPNMGSFLNMVNSAKPAPGMSANQNFARELLQLFTLGPDLLNQDGTLQMDATGGTIPAYSEDQIDAFSRAYTGWTYANPDNSPAPVFTGTPNWLASMGPVEAMHDQDAKALLNGVTLPAHQTALQDLNGALDNIFNQPNICPFVSRLLIQRLVTGNPTPAYVSRVAAVFADNGNGVRGDLAAVVRAILTDPEARAEDAQTGDQIESTPAVDGGHLREPIMWILSVARGLNTTGAGSDPSDPFPYVLINCWSSNIGEAPFNPLTVFNYFSPGYVVPQTAINSPEFGMEATGSIFPRDRLADLILHNTYNLLNIDFGPSGVFGPYFDDPGGLIDYLNLIFMHGQMSSDMKQVLLETITAIPDTDKATRIPVALYLVLTSSQYKVFH